MSEKVFINSQKMAKFVCPFCRKSKLADVSKYLELNKKLIVKVRCPCGNSFIASLEKRKQYRKETNLSGSFIHIPNEGARGKGYMTICNLSSTGMKLKVDYANPLYIGDLLEVKFILDNLQNTPMNKKVIIKNIDMPFVGTEFPFTETEDQTIGFYLFN
jgi:hypothetical protein